MKDINVSHRTPEVEHLPFGNGKALIARVHVFLNFSVNQIFSLLSEFQIYERERIGFWPEGQGHIVSPWSNHRGQFLRKVSMRRVKRECLDIMNICRTFINSYNFIEGMLDLM